MNFITNRRARGGLACLGLAFIAGALSYNFFINVKCPAYPWWHEFKNDIDGPYVAQTVALLNHGRLELIDHPGGTVYMLNGAMLRSACFFDKPYCMLRQLRRVPNVKIAFGLLDMAVRAARLLTFVLSVIFLCVFFLLLRQMTRNAVVSFFMTFLFCTSGAFLFHATVVRPELHNLLFLTLALTAAWGLARPEHSHFRVWSLKSFLFGLFCGLALLAKIQILPLLLVAMLALAYFILRKESALRPPPARGWPGTVIPLVSVVNLAAFPWWAVRRTEFLTEAYLANFSRDYDRRRVWGEVPESFIVPFFVVLAGLLLVTVVLQITRNPRLEKWRTLITALNAVVLGSIFSVYLVLFPLMMDLKSYLTNTNHLVYSLLTNLRYGAFLLHRITEWNTPRNIILLHQDKSHLLSLNALIPVAAVFVWSIVRLLRRPAPAGADRKFYWWALTFFCAGFWMDAMAAMRMRVDMIFEYYAVYSFYCHCLGLGVWAAGEWKTARWRWGKVNFRTLFTGLMSIHVLMICIGLWTAPKNSGVSDQTPNNQYINTHAHSPSFWRIIKQGR